MTARQLELLPIATGPAVAAALPALRRALAGDGPAVLPVPVDPTLRIPGLATALGVGAPLSAPEDDPDDPTAVVVTTSGSTGDPKGALLSSAQLTASAAATRTRLGGPGRWLLALPPWHVAGLQVLLRSLADGTEPYSLDTGIPFTAQHFVDAVAAMPDGRRYLSVVPTQLHRILDDPDAVAAATSFAAVLVGGAASSPDLLARADAAGVPVVTTYGMSETGGGCVYDGRPLDGVRVGLDDGRIVLSGPMVARGYRRRPSDPAFPTPGVFRTDDLGELVDGSLRVLGRVDDVIVSGGHKVPPAVVEEALSRVPGVGEVVVVGVVDEQWGAVVTAVVVPTGRAPDLAALRAVDLPRHFLPRRVLIVDRLPQIGPGKPDRAAIARLARSEPV